MEPNGLAVFETRERVIGHPHSVFSERSARPCLLPPRCYALGSGAVAGDADHQLIRLTTQVSKDARPFGFAQGRLWATRPKKRRLNS